jgi:hypothetical protein
MKTLAAWIFLLASSVPIMSMAATRSVALRSPA